MRPSRDLVRSGGSHGVDWSQHQQKGKTVEYLITNPTPIDRQVDYINFNRLAAGLPVLEIEEALEAYARLIEWQRVRPYMQRRN